jgi:hypothetical protein
MLLVAAHDVAAHDVAAHDVAAHDAFGSRALADHECAHGVLRHHEHPARVDPVVINQSAAIWLDPATIERFQLAVQPPVTQISLRQDRQTVTWLYDHHLCPGD